jgi:hypothetical protein
MIQKITAEKAKPTLSNIIAYIVGKYRYQFYYSKKFKWMIRKHIREQIDWRISIMDKQCYNQGTCILCGCQTTALQMANKSCEKPCYPVMVSKKYWEINQEKHKYLWQTISSLASTTSEE